MGLKLTIGTGDKVLIGSSVVAEVVSTSNKQTCIEFYAPLDIEINAVFRDSSKQFKNANKSGNNKSGIN